MSTTPPTDGELLDEPIHQPPRLSSAVRRAKVRAAVLIGPTASRRSQRGHGRSARSRDERGAATAMLVLLSVAMLAVAGLVIDGGYVLGAQRQAMGQAEQAARVGSDALSQSALRSGTTRVDPGQAIGTAQAYLRNVGATGTVNVNGGEVTVTVTGRQDTALLSAVGVSSLGFKASATAVSIDEADQ